MPYALPPSPALRPTAKQGKARKSKEKQRKARKSQEKTIKSGGREKQRKARKSYEKLGKVRKSKGTSCHTTYRPSDHAPYAIRPAPVPSPTPHRKARKSQEKATKSGGEEKQRKAGKSYEKLRKVRKSIGTSYAIRPTARQTTHLMPYAPQMGKERQGKAKKNKEKSRKNNKNRRQGKATKSKEKLRKARNS